MCTKSVFFLHSRQFLFKKQQFQHGVGPLFLFSYELSYNLRQIKLTDMKIMEINADERPRERLISAGARALSNTELLAILLRNRFRRDECFGSGQRTDGAGRKSDTTCSHVGRSSHGDQGHRERQISDHNGRI